MKPKGRSAVMEGTAGLVQEGDTPEQALQRKLSLFCTPPWAARAGAEHLHRMFPEAWSIAEPAAGLGHIAKPVAAMGIFPNVRAFDVHDWGAGAEVRDWLDDSVWQTDPPEFDLIYTNPPFPLGEEFVRRGLRRARMGVALILRPAFLEGGDRHAIMDGPDIKLTQLVTFSERVPMVMGRWDPTKSSATAYCMLIWSKLHAPMPAAWFPPGTRDRLWLPTDAALYGEAEANSSGDLFADGEAIG